MVNTPRAMMVTLNGREGFCPVYREDSEELMVGLFQNDILSISDLQSNLAHLVAALQFVLGLPGIL